MSLEHAHIDSEGTAMALIRNGTRDAAVTEKLTNRLADEIKAPRAEGAPVIHENRIAQTDRYSVTVIWDEWAGLPMEARSRVILDAYEASDASKTGKIGIAMGLTRQEAAAIGILPYAVVPNARRQEAQVTDQITEAMRREGAFQGPKGLELRFRTLDEAEEVFERLQRVVPGPYWALVHEIQRD